MNTSSDTALYTATTASATAYHELKTMLLLGEVPIGARLREERLAERLNMSRTPVREAMLKLHAERFLERHAEGGYRAANPSAQTMRELYEVRRALEIFALKRTQPGQVRDRAKLEELRDEWLVLDATHCGPDAEFVHLDEDFHRRLAESSGNQQLADELQLINERIRPVRTHDFVTPGRIISTVEQHLAIVDAVLSRRTAQATALLDNHITESQAVVEIAVAKVLERMLSIGERDNSW